MQPKLQDIAEELGVSVATVSNALSGKGRVSAQMVARVKAAAEAVGYVPSVSGRALRTGRSGVIGLVLPDISNPLFPTFAQALEAAAARAGYGVLIADAQGKAATQAEAMKRVVRQGADGLIVVPYRGTRVQDTGVPTAVIDSPSTPGNSAASDHRAGGALAMRHLLALSHRRFVLFGESRLSRVQTDRIAGMRAVMGPEARAEVVWLSEAPATDFPALASRGFTGFLATSDLHAIRALTAFQRAGIRVPQDVSLTGFDDLIFASAVSPGLTTVGQDMGAIAEAAIASLKAQIDGAPVPPGAVVPMHLVERGSTGTAPAQNHRNLQTNKEN